MLAWLPYVALALLLVASRVSPEFKASLLSVSLAFTDLWGEGGQRLH
jgi:lactate permease